LNDFLGNVLICCCNWATNMTFVLVDLNDNGAIWSPGSVRYWAGKVDRSNWTGYWWHRPLSAMTVVGWCMHQPMTLHYLKTHCPSLIGTPSFWSGFPCCILNWLQDIIYLKFRCDIEYWHIHNMHLIFIANLKHEIRCIRTRPSVDLIGVSLDGATLERATHTMSIRDHLWLKINCPPFDWHTFSFMLAILLTSSHHLVWGNFCAFQWLIVMFLTVWQVWPF